jgi:hypothetical protein
VGLMSRARSAYGAQLTAIERLTHRRGLAWNRLTWEVDGRSYSANTYPGSTANQQAEDHPEGVPARIITNGRGQVIAVEVFESTQDE